MKQCAKALKAIKIYRDAMISEGTWSEHDQGMYNGLELAASLMEDRPAFYKDEDGRNRSEDIENHPEDFR